MSVVKGIGSVFTMGREAEKRHQQALKEIADARIARNANITFYCSNKTFYTKKEKTLSARRTRPGH